MATFRCSVRVASSAELRLFKKILIANRGEIALRVIRACRELGIASVAVYSDADAHGAARARGRRSRAHRRRRRRPRAISTATGSSRRRSATGAEAIHPGYGFLSEREWFARAVRDAGLVFIGPPAEAIAAMGSKTAARQLAISAGVPVVPGTTEALRDAAEARGDRRASSAIRCCSRRRRAAAARACASCASRGEMAAALDTARREAKNAFGDDAVYVEKYIVGPRHVEIQVLGDQHGTMLSLERARMLGAAPPSEDDRGGAERRGDAGASRARWARRRCARRSAAGYVNAGTCEFLLDADGKFYFLEMNTRLQVEHPVTELVTGIDLVQWQIRIAAGEKLPFKQADIVPRGWAIECRITSEDPANGFLPSTGRISYLHLPSGPGVRWDGGIEIGQRGRAVLRSDAREADRPRADARGGGRAHASRAARAHDRRRRVVARFSSARDGGRGVPRRRDRDSVARAPARLAARSVKPPAQTAQHARRSSPR